MDWDNNTLNENENLVTEEEYLKRKIKTECDETDFLETQFPNIDTEIKTEITDFDCGEPELQEVILNPVLNRGKRGNKPIKFTEIKYFFCTCCSYKSAYKANLLRHEKKHDKEPVAVKGVYKCEKCPFESNHNAAFQRHKNVHSDIYYKCPQCEFATKHKDNLRQHELIHKSPSECEMYACEECEYETKQKLCLKRHVLTHRRLEEVEHHKCPYCKFVTKHQISMNNHILTIHKKDKIEKYMCPECDFGTYHKISLKSHRLTHRKPGEVPMYKCPQCTYETKNKAFLTNHMKSHLGTVPCPKCQKLITPRGMPLHLKTHESGDVKNRYKCKECTYATLYFGNFSRHMKIMHLSKEAIDYKICPEPDCPFKTFENARLKRHIKEIHSSEAPQFKCGDCEFTSKFNSCLKRHVETAHGDKNPETCPVCFKKSANIYTLRIHMKLHRKEDEIRMFQCGECPYKTRHSGAYKDHLLRHKSPDEIPVYKCTNCSYQAKNKSYLVEHISKYSDSTSPKNKVCCPCCCFKTATKCNLRIHMSKVHRNEMDPNEFWHCTLCGFKTLNKRVLHDHVKAHKKNAINSEGEKKTIDYVPDMSKTCEVGNNEHWDTSHSGTDMVITDSLNVTLPERDIS